ncbi:MAG: hypothetical protein IJK53_08320 [Erysipelotrichaceae bacterium]|nr:hypothetical protein [Erysipelotrichaceae bacterium]
MKSKQAKAHQISMKTKIEVWYRQGGRSIFSGRPITPEMCCCHFVSKGCGGVGEEWNIFGCYQGFDEDEHRLFDLHKPIGDMSAEECADKLIDHFSSLYDGWSKDLCRYRKGWKKKDYGISRFKYEGYQIEELVL